jgi:hypothetical protein
MIRGSVTVETLPVDVSMHKSLKKRQEMQGQRLGKNEPQRRCRITQTLTIWLSLRDNSGGGDDCC